MIRTVAMLALLSILSPVMKSDTIEVTGGYLHRNGFDGFEDVFSMSGANFSWEGTISTPRATCPGDAAHSFPYSCFEGSLPYSPMYIHEFLFPGPYSSTVTIGGVEYGDSGLEMAFVFGSNVPNSCGPSGWCANPSPFPEWSGKSPFEMLAYSGVTGAVEIRGHGVATVTVHNVFVPDYDVGGGSWGWSLGTADLEFAGPEPIPEPGTSVLLTIGIAGAAALGGYSRTRFSELPRK